MKKLLIPIMLVLLALSLIAQIFMRIVEKNETKDDGAPPFFVKEKLKAEWIMLRDPATNKIPDNIRNRELEFARSLPGAQILEFKNDQLLAEDWQLRGPFNIGGRTRALQYDSRDENTIQLGAVSGGMWKSLDRGQTWTVKTTPDQIKSVSCITQDTRQGKEDTWYYGTGEYFNIFGGLRGNGVFKSTDNGETWFALESTQSNTPQTWDNNFDYVWNIVTDPVAEEDVIVAATAVGSIKRSSDGGETWNSMLGGFGNEGAWYTDVQVTSNGIYYAALSQATFDNGTAKTKGIYRSTDGIKWIDITPEFMPEKYKRIVIAIAPSEENIVYFMAETPGTGKITIDSRGEEQFHSIWVYNYISGEGTGDGGTWEDRSESVPYNPAYYRESFFSQGSYDLVINVKPDDPNFVVVGGTSLFRSTDGFKTSNNTTMIGGYCPLALDCRDPYTYTNQHADQHVILFSRNNTSEMYSGSDGGAHLTYDCHATPVVWTSLNNGFYTTQFYSVAVDPVTPGSDLIVGGLQDNGSLICTTANNKDDWNMVEFKDGFWADVDAGAENLYVSENTNKQPKIHIWRERFDNDGKRFSKVRIDPDGGYEFIWNTPFVLDPNDQNKMYLAGGYVVWRNSDLSQIPVEDNTDSTSIGWDSLAVTHLDSVSTSVGFDEKVTSIAISENPENILYYGTYYSRVFRVDNSDTEDIVAKDITGDNFPSLSTVTCVAIDPDDADKVFAVMSNYSILSIFYTEDGGESWVPVSGNLEERPDGSGAGPAVFWVEILKIGDHKLYFAGTSIGVFSTAYLDGPSTVWKMESASMIGNSVCRTMDSRESDGLVVAGTYGYGVFSKNFTTMPALPPAPGLIFPADEAKAIHDTTTFKWDAVEDAVFYKIEISQDPEFTTIDQTIDAVTDTKIYVKDLEQGYKDYFWRVQARSYAGIGSPSAPYKFKTAIAPPTLVYPENKEKNLPEGVDLRWNKVEGADAYHLLVGERIKFTDIVFDITGITDTTIKIDWLTPNTYHNWVVSAIDEDGEGVFQSYFRFKTAVYVSVDEAITEQIGITSIAPNPVSGSAIVNFSLPKSANAIFALYDLNGKKIKSYPTMQVNKGSNQFEMNTEGINSGVYYLRMQANGMTFAKKVTISK
jgi:type IX secretion system substrate protein